MNPPLLATILERLVERIGGERSRVPRACYDDASWVGFRLAELLPFSLAEKQRLLLLTEPVERLETLQHWLPRFQQE